ncbi:MAG: phage major capsid protein [Gemmatimonadota bacterium]|nr:phage major capsid protein [Gemmatimonadota bacterium]MDE2814309.1 phage major capsid protein [Gemmatimonadota bacterium]
MTDRQRIELRRSRIRQRLSELLGIEERSEEQTNELADLQTEYETSEVELRAAITAESDDESGTDDGSGSARSRLESRASIAGYLQAAVTGAALTGAELELRQELELPEGQMPISVLMSDADVEARADAATSAPATTGISQSNIMPRLFPRAVANQLGVSMPTVPAGQRNFVFMASGTSASMAAAGTAVDAVAGTFSTVALSPVALQARYVFSQESTLTLAGMEAALASDLRMLLSDKMDQLILEGSGSAPEVSGFFNTLTAPTAEGTTDTALSYASKLYGAIDGVHASSPADVRLLVGTKTLTHMGSVFFTNTAVNADSWLRANSAGVLASKHVADPASGVQDGLVTRIRMGAFDAVAPVWSGVSMMRDPYSGLSKREVAIQLTMFWNFAVVRADAYGLVSFKIA